uniref:antibiotic biosynthesis monooxygenase family protein n=1 Tax=Roseivirga sp. TaxID=1964215 RepID=UPI00404838A4
MSNMNSYVLEVVRYQIKPESTANFKNILNLARTEIMKTPGFVEFHTFNSTKNPSTYIDLVYWSSLEEAQSAAQEMMKLTSLKPWMDAFEKVEFMEHFNFYL